MTNIDIGEKIYDNFCSKFPEVKVATPRTTMLELFTLLQKRKEYDLLLREIMKEFISNIDDTEIFADKGKLYYKSIIVKEIIKL